jgi:hypothetical protein
MTIPRGSSCVRYANPAPEQCTIEQHGPEKLARLNQSSDGGARTVRLRRLHQLHKLLSQMVAAQLLFQKSLEKKLLL